MRIIISPAKQMRTDTDSYECNDYPVFMEKTEALMQWIRSLSYEEQKKLWACNDKIARQNAERFAHEERATDHEYVFIRTAVSGKPRK